MLCPGDTIIGLGRSSLEPFGLQANRGIYSIERWSVNYWYCQEMQIATFLNTIPAIGGPAINNNGRVIGMLFQARTCTPFLPSNIILKWWEYFKEIGKYCRPTISVLGVNLHDAHSSPLVNIPKSLHSGLDGLLVEMVSEAVASEGLQENDLIVRCNGKHVATSLQLFEILASNIGKRVELSVVKSEDGSSRSIYLPVEEVVEENFYLWRIAYYDRGLC